jgi:hypothetical protein
MCQIHVLSSCSPRNAEHATPNPSAATAVGFPSPASGSRFSCLVGERGSDDEAGTLAESVAWQGIEEEPLVPPINRSLEFSLADIVMDFWSKIGYPSSESRSWERNTDGGSPEVSFLSCRSGGRTRSSSPARQVKEGQERRAKDGCLEGALPRRQCTPLPVLGEFFINATKVDTTSARDPSSAIIDKIVRTSTRSVSGSTGATESDSMGAKKLDVDWVDHTNFGSEGWHGPQPRWDKLGRGILATKRVIYSSDVRTYAQTLIPSTGIHKPQLVAIIPSALSTPSARPLSSSSPPPSSTSPSPSSSSRSFAAVVAGPRPSPR